MAEGQKRAGRGPTRMSLGRRVHDKLWRSYIWLDGTLPLSMLEYWEKALLLIVVVFLSALAWWSLFFHLPNHVRYMVSKGAYYLFGTRTSADVASFARRGDPFFEASAGVSPNGFGSSADYRHAAGEL